ncbi:hypothetical protein M885DRAFT_618411 [Pelagophyceae sp. CCMP2097]|nr:hypothetical protein M885DRAFT_618411 [Pelagophyceae sp. CCMP2097]
MSDSEDDLGTIPLCVVEPVSKKKRKLAVATSTHSLEASVAAAENEAKRLFDAAAAARHAREIAERRAEDEAASSRDPSADAADARSSDAAKKDSKKEKESTWSKNRKKEAKGQSTFSAHYERECPDYWRGNDGGGAMQDRALSGTGEKFSKF